MNKYTLSQIISAWESAYGEDMSAEYPGFIQRLTEENPPSKTIKIEVNAGVVTDVTNLPEGYDYEIVDHDLEDEHKPQDGKVYALTGARGDRCIANGNTWKESEVKDD